MKIFPYVLLSFFLLNYSNVIKAQTQSFQPQTKVEIKGAKWYINGEPTLKGEKWRNYTVEGLSPNSRMVLVTFDDSN